MSEQTEVASITPPPDPPQEPEQIQVDAFDDPFEATENEPDLSAMIGEEDYTEEAVPDDEDTGQDDLDDMREMVAEQIRDAMAGKISHDDLFLKVFPAKLNTDGTFQELLVCNGTLGPFDSGRTNDTTNQYVTLNSTAQTNGLIVEIEDTDANGAPITGWVAINANGTSSGSGIGPNATANSTSSSMTVISNATSSMGSDLLTLSATWQSFASRAVVAAPQISRGMFTEIIANGTINASAPGAANNNAIRLNFGGGVELTTQLPLIAAGPGAQVANWSMRTTISANGTTGGWANMVLHCNANLASANTNSYGQVFANLAGCSVTLTAGNFTLELRDDDANTGHAIISCNQFVVIMAKG